jgi:hypothetical protein
MNEDLYPKVRRLRLLQSLLPGRFLARTHVTSRHNEAFFACLQMIANFGSVGIRTDRVGGGDLLPFLYDCDDPARVAAFLRSTKDRGLIWIVGEKVTASINGKILRVGDHDAIIEWARCQSARDVDAGTTPVTTIAVSTDRHAVWGHVILDCVHPLSLKHPLFTVYKWFLRTGAADLTWSVRDDNHQIIFWS